MCVSVYTLPYIDKNEGNWMKEMDMTFQLVSY